MKFDVLVCIELRYANEDSVRGASDVLVEGEEYSNTLTCTTTTLLLQQLVEMHAPDIEEALELAAKIELYKWLDRSKEVWLTVLEEAFPGTVSNGKLRPLGIMVSTVEYNTSEPVCRLVSSYYSVRRPD